MTLSPRETHVVAPEYSGRILHNNATGICTVNEFLLSSVIRQTVSSHIYLTLQ